VLLWDSYLGEGMGGLLSDKGGVYRCDVESPPWLEGPYLSCFMNGFIARDLSAAGAQYLCPGAVFIPENSCPVTGVPGKAICPKLGL
jgi:hypothetical protein